MKICFLARGQLQDYSTFEQNFKFVTRHFNYIDYDFYLVTNNGLYIKDESIGNRVRIHSDAINANRLKEIICSDNVFLIDMVDEKRECENIISKITHEYGVPDKYKYITYPPNAENIINQPLPNVIGTFYKLKYFRDNVLTTPSIPEYDAYLITRADLHFLFPFDLEKINLKNSFYCPYVYWWNVTKDVIPENDVINFQFLSFDMILVKKTFFDMFDKLFDVDFSIQKIKNGIQYDEFIKRYILKEFNISPSLLTWKSCLEIEKLDFHICGHNKHYPVYSDNVEELTNIKNVINTLRT